MAIPIVLMRSSDLSSWHDIDQSENQPVSCGIDINDNDSSNIKYIVILMIINESRSHVNGLKCDKYWYQTYFVK